MSKKIIAIFIYLMILIVVFKYSSFKVYENELEYHIDNIQELKEINIDVKNTDLVIIPSVTNTIKIKRLTNNQKFNQVEHNTDYVDGILTIKDYIKKDHINENIKDVLTIQIPQEAELENASINSSSGKIQIEKLTADNLNIKSTERINLLIDESNFTNTYIDANIIQIENINVLNREKIIYKIDHGKIIERNSNGKNAVLDNKGKVEYINENSTYINFNMLNDYVDVNLKLSKDNNYIFKNPQKSLSGKEFTENEKISNTYNYTGDKNNTEVYIFNFNNNKIKDLVIE